MVATEQPNPTAAERQPLRHRLTISLLLLWTATTCVALAWLKEQRPPPAERIGFASFLSQRGTDVEAAMAKMRRRIWRRWQNKYLVGLATAPIYGAALAGGVLALWNVVTGRFAFPAQPGHWLLVVLAGWAMLMAGWQFLRSLPFSANDPGWIIAILLGGLLLAATVRVRPDWWIYPFWLAAAGMGLVIVGYVVHHMTSSIEPPLVYVLGLLLTAGTPLAVLLSIYIDSTMREPRDVLHWTGVATFFCVVGHFIAVIVAVRF